MKFTTVEVELEGGRVTPRGVETLPPKAAALLTILQPPSDLSQAAKPASAAGLRRFLAAPALPPLTADQWAASMEGDFFDP